ncbi:MAG: hypothetical protein OXF99_03505 [bacterium]|nr:hypothetical protein [bacterium]
MWISAEGSSSTAPLRWVETASGSDRFELFHRLESAGGGHILRRHYSGPDEPIQLVATTNGISWAELGVPRGIQLADLASSAAASVDLSGDRWVVYGRDVYSETPGPFQVARSPQQDWAADRVWFSDDRGESWVEMDVELPLRAEPLPPFVTEESEVVEAVASGSQVVVVVQFRTELDLEALVVDRGLQPEGTTLMNWSMTDDGVALEFTSRHSPGHTRIERFASFGALGLCAEQPELLSRGDQSVIRVYSSSGPVAVQQAEHHQWVWNVTGAGAKEGFVLGVQGRRDALLCSQDGQDWTTEPLGEVAQWADGRDGRLWAASPVAGGMGIDCISCVGGRTPAALLDGFVGLTSFSSGPAGLAAAALPADNADRPSSDGSVSAGEVWLCWSADGSEWGWQRAAEAFGIDLHTVFDLELAVGGDFILARVWAMGMSRAAPARRGAGNRLRKDFGGAFSRLPEPRCFLARVP